MLRQALRTNRQQMQTAIGASIQAPAGGWDAISPLPKMPPGNAVILDNMIPRPGYCEVRKGSRAYMTGAPADVESLLAWRGGSAGVDQLFAAAVPGIYAITDFGDAWPASSHTITNSRVNSTAFANDGGSFIICANGDDTPFSYNGTTWANLTISGSSGPIVLDPADLDFPTGFKSRLFFMEKDSLRVWFLDTRAIQGTAQLLDLGPYFKEGGTLDSLQTWSNPFGLGQDDYFAAITSEGECAIFQGDDPSNSLYWAAVGDFHIGKPVGGRAFVKYGGDLLAITSNGVISFNQALNLDRSKQNTVALTQKIQNAFSMATQAYGTNFGWAGLLYERGSLAIFNIPIVELETSYQYVQNLQTGAWCRFKGLDAFCWEVKDTSIFFGAADGVRQWDIGVTDAGEDLVYEALTAFSYFGNPSRIKNFTMVRPILNATANVQPAIEIDVDYKQSVPTSVPTVINDRSDTLEIRADWSSCQGVGYCGAVHLKGTLSADSSLQSILAIGDGNTLQDGAGNDIVTDSGEPVSAQIQLISFDLMYEPGGQL